MALATSTDVEAILGRSLSVDEATRADALLVTASASVEAAAGGYRFAPGSYTVTRRPVSCRVYLPAAVATVAAVREVDQETGAETAITDYTLRGSTLYGVDEYEVEVDFTVTAAVPDEVVKIVAGVAAATFESGPAGAASQAVGQVSVSYADSSGRVWLSKSDKAILGKYRRPRPALILR